MPVYNFKHSETDEGIIVSCSSSQIKQKEQELKEQGYQRVFALNFAGARRDAIGAQSDGFADVLRRIKKGSGKDNTIEIKN